MCRVLISLFHPIPLSVVSLLLECATSVDQGFGMRISLNKTYFDVNSISQGNLRLLNESCVPTLVNGFYVFETPSFSSCGSVQSVSLSISYKVNGVNPLLKLINLYSWRTTPIMWYIQTPYQRIKELQWFNQFLSQFPACLQPIILLSHPMETTARLPLLQNREYIRHDFVIVGMHFIVIILEHLSPMCYVWYHY